MLLRRFYIQENEKGRSLTKCTTEPMLTFSLAPNPRPKKNRELNTRFEDEDDVPPIS
jgi:tRNA-specific adenosine deaminase 2